MRSKGKGNQIFMADRDPRTRRPAQVTLMARKSAPVSAGGINARRLERWRLAAMAAEREEEEDDDYVDEEEEDEEDEEESDDDEDDDEEEEKEEEEKEPNNQCGNPFCRQILANRYARYCEDKPLCQRYRALKLQCLANAQAEEEEEDTRPLALVIKKKKKKKEEKEKKKEEEPFAIPRRKKTEIGGKRRLNLNATAAPIEGKSRSNSNSPREMVKKRQKKRDMDKRLEEEKEKEEKKQRKKLKRAREAAGSKGTTSVSVTSNSPSVQGSSVSSEEEFVSLADELKTRRELGANLDPRRQYPDSEEQFRRQQPYYEGDSGRMEYQDRRTGRGEFQSNDSYSSGPGQWEGRSYPPPRDHYPPRQQEPSSFGASNGRDGGSFDYAMDTHFSPASSPPDQSYRRENQREDPPLPLRAPSPRRSEPERVNGDRRTSDFDDLDEDAPTFSYNEVFLPQLLSIFIHKFPSALDAISNVTKKPRKMNWYINSEVADAAEQSDPGEEMSISDASDPGAITPAGSPLLPTTHASSSVPLATPGSDVTVPDSTVAGSSATTSSVAFSSTTTESSVAPLPSSVPSGIAAMVAKFAAAAGVSTAPNSQSTAKTTVPARRCMMCEMIRMRKPDGERCLRCQQKDAPANGLLGSSLDP
ncbi:hypothetical protein PF010_g14077 [Phytophthora fragariae]|uniref:Uncharacterized protein n=1 Tax=Phytophthora fragariae TaxID=53985 RepID=A0A6G0KYU7_9STRA|nr:hypothetical protein PF010_g14077 [Phytophthora fragariae]